MGTVPTGCARCRYLGKSGCYYTCDYLLITGCRRPSPPGTGCTVKETKVRRKSPWTMTVRRKRRHKNGA